MRFSFVAGGLALGLVFSAGCRPSVPEPFAPPPASTQPRRPLPILPNSTSQGPWPNTTVSGGGAVFRSNLATAGGKYRGLLRVFEESQDEATYGEFHDWGYWSGTEYAGHEKLPAGYWVYVAPRWYIWSDANEEYVSHGPIGKAAAEPDPFSEMAEGDTPVTIHLAKEQVIYGDVKWNGPRFLIMDDAENPNGAKRILVNKS
ncbi:MAG: hypothetical protein N2C14_14310, partial [Planctomycetales bacterium]